MMKPIAVNQLSDNFFETISKEWMLVTASNKDAFNTMTVPTGVVSDFCGINRLFMFSFVRKDIRSALWRKMIISLFLF